jgi:hypothetical protein
MLIGDEPSNGNYTRYVEMLTTGNGGEPGRVYTWRQKAARPIRMSSPTGMPPVPPELAVDAPAGIAGPTPGSIIIALPDGFAKANPTLTTPVGQTLASQASSRITSMLFTLLGLGTVCVAFVMALRAVTLPDFELTRLRPVIFLLAFAFIFFRGAKNARKNTLKPLQNHPSLTTVKPGSSGDSR